MDVFETQLVHIKELNLARNKLFNGDMLFQVRQAEDDVCSKSINCSILGQALVNLKQLKKLNVSENCLNGPLSRHACELTALEELHLDTNRLSSLPADCSAWASLRVLTVSDNCLQGEISDCCLCSASCDVFVLLQSCRSRAVGGHS